MRQYRESSEMATITTNPPSVAHVKTIIARLLGDGVVVTTASRRPRGANHVVAEYVDQSGMVQRVLVCDLSFANKIGAALTMIPPALAEDATASGKIPNNIRDNLHEVLNICVNLFSETVHERLVLYSVKLSSEPEDHATNQLFDGRPTKHAAFKIDVPNYGTGQIELIVAG
jgi:hypothetical protein